MHADTLQGLGFKVTLKLDQDQKSMADAIRVFGNQLKAGGAGTVEGEWAAAMRYFSGGTNKKYRFYGDNVVKMANQYQQEIESLGQ